MIVVIDNYDSFVHNLARYIVELGFKVCIFRNDAVSLEEIAALAPTHIVLSPGPCSPNEAGICLPLIEAFYDKIPILGICLGHQAIGQAFGASVERAVFPRHGKASSIEWIPHPLFNGIANPLLVGRYHSLVVRNLPVCLETIAYSLDDREIMAIVHRKYPVVGFQFHPESILTQQGYALLKRFFLWSLESKIRSVNQISDATIHTP